MILLSFIVVVAVFNNDVLGSPVYSSSVYLQRGTGGGPALEYVEYEPSALSFGSPQYTRLATAPSSFYPTQYSGISPCVSPCVYEAAVAPAPAPQSAKLVTYQAPVSNVVIAPHKIEQKSEPYQYSYVIYDENTGDQKAQKELSEGGVVKGHYSFVQPNGYVRYVQYTADDINGFNAVVNNFLPKAKSDSVEIQEEKHEVVVEPHPNSDVDEASKQSVKELGSTEDISEENEPETLSESAEVTTDVIPEKEEIKKYVLTYEDLINCAQAVFEGADIKKHEPHGVPVGQTGHEGHGHKTPEAHAGHESHGPAGHADHGEHGHEVPASPASPVGHTNHELPAAHGHSTHGVPHGSYGVPMAHDGHVQDEPVNPVQPHPPLHEAAASHKSPLTYIILPSLGGKPC